MFLLKYFQNKEIKNQFFILLFVILPFIANSQNDFTKQLRKNMNIGWNVFRTDDYRWRNIYVGTGYSEPISENLNWSVGANLNWGKYTLYPNRILEIPNRSTLKTTSLTFPVMLNYQLYKSRSSGLNFFTGPQFETIIYSKLDGYSFNNLNNFQTGWTIGSSYRFLYFLRLQLGYTYYPISLFSNHSMPRSALNFSVGF